MREAGRMLVHIVIVPDAARMGPDLTRTGKVEDLPDELGRLMLANGTGREPTDDEVATFREAQQLEAKADEATATGGDLTKLTKPELLKLAEGRGVEVPPHATKADVTDAIRQHQGDAPPPGDITDEAPAGQ